MVSKSLQFYFLVLLVWFLTAVPAAAQQASSVSSTLDLGASEAKPPLVLTYRSSSLASRLARDGALLRLTRNLTSQAAPPAFTLHEIDLDQQPEGGTTAVRRKLADTKATHLLALEPSIDPNFLPIVDSLGLTVLSVDLLDANSSQSIRGLFSVYPRLVGARDAVTRFLIAQPSVNAFYLLCSNSRLGLGYNQLWEDVASERGIALVRSPCANESSFDFRVNFLRARAARVNGIAIGFGTELVLHRLREMNWKMPMLVPSYEAERLLHAPPNNTALEGAAVFFDAPVISELFANAFTEAHPGVQATISAALGYEATDALIRAVGIANTPATDGRPASGDTRNALRTLRYDGVAGEVDFRMENSGNMAKSVLMQLEQGVAARVN